jgi:hypothetical protein
MTKYLQEEIENFTQKIQNFSLKDNPYIKTFTTDENLQQIIHGFLKLISNLREDMEEQTPLILQQLYNKLYLKNINNIAKAIIQIMPDRYYTNALSLSTHEKLISGDCYFSLMENLVLWPLKIKKYEFISSNLVTDVNINTNYILKITIESLNIPIKKMTFNNLRFFVEGKDDQLFFRECFLNQNRFTAYTSDNDIQKFKEHGSDFYNPCIVNWIFPDLCEGIEILQNFSEIPEIYSFFTIENLIINNIFNNLCIYIPININRKLNINLYLWCAVIKNSIICQSDSFKVKTDILEQQLTVNSFHKNLYIHEVKECILINQNTHTNITYDNWCSSNKNNNTYLCFLKNTLLDLQNKWCYCKVIVHNGEQVNNLDFDSPLKFDNYINFSCKFLITPTYTITPVNIDNIFQYLNTDYKQLLSTPEIFQNVINNLLSMWPQKYFFIVNKVVCTNIISHQKWGKNFVPIMGKNIFLEIKTNAPDPLLFLKILHKFITNFSTINLFINLELEWKGVIYKIEEEIHETSTYY